MGKKNGTFSVMSAIREVQQLVPISLVPILHNPRPEKDGVHNTVTMKKDAEAVLADRPDICVLM